MSEAQSQDKAAQPRFNGSQGTFSVLQNRTRLIGVSLPRGQVLSSPATLKFVQTRPLSLTRLDSAVFFTNYFCCSRAFLLASWKELMESIGTASTDSKQILSTHFPALD